MLDSLFDNSYVAFAGLVIGFGLLIFVHELGHFLVAKWVGVRATQFAIGFGNAICTYRKGMGLTMGSTEQAYQRQGLERLSDQGVEPDQASERQVYEAADELGLGETEYRLNTLPLGGYVKMLGQEDTDPAARSDDPRSFNNQSARARLAILSAGVVMNVIFGVVLLTGAFMIGVRFPAAQIGQVLPGQPAANTFAQGHQGDPTYLGLRMGDDVLAVNHQPASDFMDLRIATALGRRGAPVPVQVNRAGEDQPLTYDIVPKPGRRTGLLSAGVTPGRTLRIRRIAKDSQAYKEQGIRADMVITAVNGQSIETLGQYVHAFERAGGKPLPVSFKNPDTGQRTQAKLTPQAGLSAMQHAPPNLIGLVPPAVVDSVRHESPAEEAGVKAGDLIARIGDVRWPRDVSQVAAMVKQAGGEPMPLAVWRDGSMKELGLVEAKNGVIGVSVRPLSARPIIGSTLADSPASQLDELPSGSRITAVNGNPVKSWTDLQRLLAKVKAQPKEDGSAKARAGADAEAKMNAPSVSRDSDSDASDKAKAKGEGASSQAAATVELTVELALSGRPTQAVRIPLSRQDIAYLHAARWLPPLGELGLARNMTLVKGKGPLNSIVIGLRKTKQFMVQTYMTLARLFQGTIGLRHLRGPVGIVDEGTKIASKGFSYLLFFLGLISINLAVINFLPIPIVDGGHVLFLAVEKIKGSPVSARVQTWASIAGLVLIGFVFLTTLYYDVGRIEFLNNLQLFGG